MTMTRNSSKQYKMHFITLEEFVPQDHIVRKLQAAIDWDFIYDLVEDYYSPVGRKSIDPVTLFKIPMWNIINGNNSIRKTCRQAESDLALKWFLNLDIDDPVPNYSDWSQNYIRRFAGTNICSKIFDHILNELISQKFIDPSILYIDSTHQKANANKNRYSKIETVVEEYSFEAELKDEINKVRAEHHQKPLKEIQPAVFEFDEADAREKEVSVKKKQKL